MKSRLIFFFVFISFMASAQNRRFQGSVEDDFSHDQLSEASIVLLTAKDSFIVSYTRTLENGQFRFEHLAAGSYILFITYPKYADYTVSFSLSAQDSVYDIGKIPIMQKAHLLQDIIVKSRSYAIRIKGDTTEFKADSFKVGPHATVEDLLKRLPGLEVDNKGNITAQGQAIKEVLVDGEEFFNEDPTLVTRNLEANMVDKIQLYDKKSEQSAFTGIDDGKSKKVLNLKMKENRKNGYFGKVYGGLGDHGVYEAQAMINSFKGKRKFAVFGTTGNTGLVGLGSADRNQNGITNSNSSTSDEGVTFQDNSDRNELDSWNGKFDGKGVPRAISAGLHYDNKWKDDSESVNGNYRFGDLHVKGENQNIIEQNLPASIYVTRSDNQFSNYILRNDMNGSFETLLKGSSSLKFSLQGSLIHKATDNSYSSLTEDADSLLLNKNGRTLNVKSNRQTIVGNLIWRKKFKKDRRTLSLNLNENFDNNKSSGFLNSETDYYNSIGNIGSSVFVNQYKTIHGENNMLASKLVYTEPIGKKLTLVADYGILLNDANSLRKSFNASSNGSYSEMDSAYSSHYSFNQFIQRGGVAFAYKSGKVRFQFGTDGSLDWFTQKDFFDGNRLNRQFTNWYPQANLTYSFSSQNNLVFQYNGKTVLPTIGQLQPVQLNDDPLNVYIGNPKLDPAFEHNVTLMYINYKLLTSETYFAYFGYDVTNRPIVLNSQTSESGQNSYQYINLSEGDNSSYWGDLLYRKAFKNTPYTIKLSGDFYNTKFTNVINGVQNITHANKYCLGITLSYSEKNNRYNFDRKHAV